MRVENHVHVRHILLYHFEKGRTAGEAFRDINELFGDGTIGRNTAIEWFARFRSGDTSLEEKKGRGRRSDLKGANQSMAVVPGQKKRHKNA